MRGRYRGLDNHTKPREKTTDLCISVSGRPLVGLAVVSSWSLRGLFVVSWWSPGGLLMVSCGSWYPSGLVVAFLVVVLVVVVLL